MVHFRNMVDQFLGFFPAEARICDGFTIDMIADPLASRFNIAFDHNAFYHLFDIGGYPAVVHDLLDDADLLDILLVGIGVVRINDSGRIF